MVEARRHDMITTLALDLEGTLISNAVSQFPRHGLREFLSWCNDHFPRIVLFTAVRPELARAIIVDLAARGDAPPWFASIEVVVWSGRHKDLAFIARCRPEEAVIVDDQEAYILDSQKDRWVAIPEYARPFTVQDDGLWQARKMLEEIVGRHP